MLYHTMIIVINQSTIIVLIYKEMITVGFLSVGENNRVLSDLDIFFVAVWGQMVREASASFQ